MKHTPTCRLSARSLSGIAASLACAGALAAAPLGDVDGDGRDELLLRNAQYGSWLYYDIDGRRARLRRIGGATRDLAYEVAGTGDFDGDGSAEMLLRHRGSGGWLHYAVQGRRAKLARVSEMTTNRAYRPVAVGDFDGGGTHELLLRNIVDGHWAAYDGVPTSPEMRRLSGVTADFPFRLEGVGDFDGDGADEVLLRHAADGSWLVANPEGEQADANVVAGLPTTADHRPAGVGDFDGDGADEVMLRYLVDGTWHPYDIAGAEATAASLTRVTTNLDYEAAGVGDVDGDGDDELMLRHAKGGQWIYYALADGRGSLLRPAGATKNRAWRMAVTAADPLVRADRSIGQYLAEPVEAGRSPGLFAAIFGEGGVRAIAVAGNRKQDAAPMLTVADLVHIGSCTKAMTSTMLATLVADGTFRNGWETSFADVFPGLLDDVHDDYHAVTLRQLVTMTGGVRENAMDWLAHRDLPILERRMALLKDNLAHAPAGAAGEFLYSNLGYMVAAVMAEKRTGRSWEVLMRERLFTPLGMFSAGYGSPGELGAIDQPWGHRRDGAGRWQAIQHDNAAALGPAGRVHLTLEDWAAFAGLWLTRDGSLIGLSRDALQDLATPPSGGYYAAGWAVGERDWASGTGLWHYGSNTMWYALLAVAPNLGRAYVVAANSADGETRALLESTMGALLGHELPGL